MGMWMAGIRVNDDYTEKSARATRVQRDQEFEARIKDLEYHVGRLSMMNQALWELLSERLGMSDADLARKAGEVDLRDGVQDGRITTTPVKCPTCGRVSNSRHWKCLYCGQLFERPIMG